VPTTGDDTTTTGETTGGAELRGARVVYGTTKPDGKGSHELFFVDCTGDTPGPAIRIHEPLEDGWSVMSWRGISESGKWMHYTLVHETLGQQVWLVDMSGPLPGTPKRVEIPPDLPPDFVPWKFSQDETKLALLLAQPGGGMQLYLCPIAADGGCVAEEWGVPLQPGGGQSFAVHFSPDGSRISYLGDPDGDGAMQLFLAGTGPGDAGEAVVVSGDAVLDDNVDQGWFSKDGATLYFMFGPSQNSPGVRAVDVTSDPPGAPQTVVPVGGSFAFRGDDSAVLWWNDPDPDGFGDLTFFRLDGTKVGPGVPVHDAPEVVGDNRSRWSSDGRFALYLAGSPGNKKAAELFAVDASGPTLAAPVKLSAPIAADGKVDFVFVGPDPSYAVYMVLPTLQGSQELHMVPLEPPGEPVMLSAPIPPEGGFPGTVIFSDDGSRILYTVSRPSGSQNLLVDLFAVDTASPGAPVQVNPPLNDEEQVSWAVWSQDGDRAFYTLRRAAPEEVTERRLFQVDIDAPGVALPVSDPAHRIDASMILPPSSE